MPGLLRFLYIHSIALSLQGCSADQKVRLAFLVFVCGYHLHDSISKGLLKERVSKLAIEVDLLKFFLMTILQPSQVLLNGLEVCDNLAVVIAELTAAIAEESKHYADQHRKPDEGSIIQLLNHEKSGSVRGKNFVEFVAPVLWLTISLRVFRHGQHSREQTAC